MLLAWLRALGRDPAPLELLDTHAGGGAYDLSAVPAARSGEARGGIGRFLDDEPLDGPVAALTAQVRALNGGEAGPLYPGSPVLACAALRPGDAYVGCELEPQAAAALRATLRAHPGAARAEVREGDGYAAAVQARPGVRRALLIDPPFERGDEAGRVTGALAAAVRRGEPAAVWAPIKDLDGFDRLLGAVEALRPPATWVVQVRLRPLREPLRLNGCAMLLLGGPDLGAEAQAIAEAVVARCGEAGGRAVRERLAT